MYRPTYFTLSTLPSAARAPAARGVNMHPLLGLMAYEVTHDRSTGPFRLYILQRPLRCEMTSGATVYVIACVCDCRRSDVHCEALDLHGSCMHHGSSMHRSDKHGRPTVRYRVFGQVDDDDALRLGASPEQMDVSLPDALEDDCSKEGRKEHSDEGEDEEEEGEQGKEEGRPLPTRASVSTRAAANLARAASLAALAAAASACHIAATVAGEATVCAIRLAAAGGRALRMHPYGGHSRWRRRQSPRALQPHAHDPDDGKAKDGRAQVVRADREM